MGNSGLLLVAALAWAARSSAAPGDAPRTSPEAQARFEAGVAAYEEGRYREAVERFKEADQLAPSPLLSFNIAKVFERMADNRNALAWYRDYLRRLPGADNRSVVSERISALEAALRATGVQQVTVLSSPAGATVAIDNVSRGVTPWTGELIPGPHTLSLTLSGYRDSVSEIELPEDHAIDIDTPLVSLVVPPPSEPTNDEKAAPEPGSHQPPGAAEAPAASIERSWMPRWWTWALFGGAAAGFIGAGAFEMARSDMEEQARKEPVQIDYQQKYDSMEQRQTLARAFLGVGIVAAVAGGVSLYFDWEEAQAASDVAFGCDAAGCSLAVGGRF
ncbi:MAG TPA: PEGA domain-containing protein [Polyangiaceae bacterium]|nr:PEGA domain-containing protein [Polyangiaceae bacterium]